MRKERRKLSHCRRCDKVAYRNQPLAEDAAADLMSRQFGSVISVYECPHVPKTYHITKTSQIWYRENFVNKPGEPRPQ